jgi:hypothetical protein
MLMSTICRAQVARQPEIALVTAEDADPETYRYMRETVAWARSDHAEAERLRALAPPDASTAQILAEEGGDHGRALARRLCAKSPENRRRQQTREAALKKALARMIKPSAPATPRPRSGRSKPR